ncbi:D-xylose 1-dehydrogenase [Fusarium oxysporum f. sp. albedinis]|nr:D-xylose 1-dehydrogenase [Fusarium oxysporum f. sp. albedinis]
MIFIPRAERSQERDEGFTLSFSCRKFTQCSTLPPQLRVFVWMIRKAQINLFIFRRWMVKLLSISRRYEAPPFRSPIIGPSFLPLIAVSGEAYPFSDPASDGMLMRTRLKSPDLYTIGWIAALPIERAAATALLHDRHDAPEGFDQHQSDTNSYTWGRIGEHNVVIASLPAGVYGTTSAATTASNLINSLPHIRIGLLVGIGGGIARPDLDHDIRLGDIVVSQPDGTTGGVVQYDLGKAKANGGLERKGSLDKPPSVLLHALASLQAEHEIEPSKVPDLLRAMLEANPGMTRPKTDFTYQGAENDRLFDSNHDHVGGSNCDKCDSTWEVKRDQRESPDPEIHYGIIASGNKLIKDAAIRDTLLEDTGHQCLCVEMEAAGLMDRFPCLVIRGICDYADSHKNDRWQRYAAATAATFAVELLEYVPATQLEATQKIAEAIQSRCLPRSVPILNLDYRTALNQLPIAEGASFDSRAEEYNSKCLPGTRVELLQNINHWIDDQNSKPILWLNGMAGTGKSTISRTVARKRHERGDLGASFFFKRGETDRGSLAKFVPTVARQLSSRFPGIAPLIKKAIDMDPDIVGKTVKEQFDKLFREPLSRVVATQASTSSVLIVIDALDECNDDADIKLLLNILSDTTSIGTFSTRVLITSRPELPVRLGFQSIDGTYQDLALHRISEPIIEGDIAIFLRHEFNNIRENFNNLKEDLRLPVHWPREVDLMQLTIAASPLFIFAATICRFIGDSCLGSPDKLLQSVLRHTSNSHASKLNITYSPVLEQQVVNRPDRERRNIIESFRLIVGTIVTLASPLSVRALALLLDEDIDEVTTRLRMLHSVLDVPENIDSPVRLLHLSFRDYLIDPENKETFEFWVDEKLVHRKLAKHCLHVMCGTLRENICGLPFPGMYRSAVDVQQVKERIPPELQYACMYWVHHQTKVDLEPDGINDTCDFLKTHFLHWLEALSLLGRISESIGFIDQLQSIVDPEKDTQALSFLHNAKRFVLNYHWIIDTAPLQLYASAIVFAPKESIIRQKFKRHLPRWIFLLPRVDTDWNAVLQTLEGHYGSVNSVDFSNDGTLIASGSDDRTIKIWNVATGKEEWTLKGHKGCIYSVAFSNDGMLIASGSDDKTIKIWNVAMGKEEWTLKGHKGCIYSVAFSNDGTRIASGLEDGTVKIWSVVTGKEEQTLKGHTGSVSSVAFSTDDKLIASGSWDTTVKIWNVETGEEERTLEGHTDHVNSVVFSSDGTLIVSGSYDKTVKIWSVVSDREEQTFKSHMNSVASVAFSKDGNLIVSGSWDKTVKMWSLTTYEEEQTLKGHADPVTSIVFSKDGTLIASGSDDGTIKIWNVATGKEERTFKGHHTGCAISVVFSNDGTRIASGLEDGTVKIWNIETGEERTLEGHYTACAISVVFSNDGTRIASGLEDDTVKIWNIETGEERTLEGHMGPVNSVSFSKDSTLIISGSDDNTIKIWDMATDREERTLEGHTGGVNSVVFSNDGTLIASGSDDYTIKIWNVVTGVNVESFDTSWPNDVSSFTDDDAVLVTSAGHFRVGSKDASASQLGKHEPKPGSPEVQGEVDARLGFGINHNKTWITEGGSEGRKVLWLPPSFRPGVSAILSKASGSVVVVGCSSGRVVIMGFEESSFSDGSLVVDSLD